MQQFEDDLLAIPSFLKRTHRPENPIQPHEAKRHLVIPYDAIRTAKRREEDREAREILHAERQEEDARRRNNRAAKQRDQNTVLNAIARGHDTFGRIRKHTELEDRQIKSALHYLKRDRQIEPDGRRYKPTGK